MIQNGLQRLEKDNRDLNTGALFQFPPISELPEEYYVEPLSIKDQNDDGNFDFCAGCAGAGMTEPKEEAVLYYPYLWAAAKYESGQDIASFGVDIRSVGKALTKWGVPELKDVPESVLALTADQRRDFKNYPQSLRDLASKHRAQTYMFLTKEQGDVYNAAKLNMWKFRDSRQQIIFGCDWSWNLSDFELTGTRTEGFGHAMWLSGWFKDGLRVVNSAGKTAGRMGTHSMSRETFNLAVSRYGALIIVDRPREDIQYFVDNKIKEGDNWLVQLLKVFWALIASPFFTTKEKTDIIKNSADTLSTLAEKIMPKIPVEETPEAIIIPTISVLDKMCKAIEEYEGYISPNAEYPKGSNAYRCKNPGNLRYAGQIGSIGKNEKGFAIFPTYEAGYEALKRQIMLVANGKSRVFPNPCTLFKFFDTYAPGSDNNDSLAYAKFVGKKMDVGLGWKLSELTKN